MQRFVMWQLLCCWSILRFCSGRLGCAGAVILKKFIEKQNSHPFYISLDMYFRKAIWGNSECYSEMPVIRVT